MRTAAKDQGVNIIITNSISMEGSSKLINQTLKSMPAKMWDQKS